ncbi:putative sugar isomerase [Streptomyces sp. Tu6071]|nr:putative sugar isomerase [Streptomyces sp. Tu6071]
MSGPPRTLGWSEQSVREASTPASRSAYSGEASAAPLAPMPASRTRRQAGRHASSASGKAATTSRSAGSSASRPSAKV